MTLTPDSSPELPAFDQEAAIGERVAFAMRRKQISQAEMAGRLGIDRSVFSKKLMGKRRWYFSEVASAADYLGLHVAELVGGKAPAGWETPDPADTSARPKGFEPLTFWLGVTAGQRHLAAVPAIR